MTIAKRLKSLRTTSGMTQEQLGQLLGVKKSAIQKYECGLVNYKVDTIIKLSKIFNVTVGYILGTEMFDQHFESNELKKEVNFIESVHRFCGDIGLELYDVTSKLNYDGLKRLKLYVEDLSQNPKYTK